MKLPDAYHAASKLRALRKLNHARGARRNDRALEDSLEKLAAWHDAPDGSEQQAKAWETWLHSPLPSW